MIKFADVIKRYSIITLGTMMIGCSLGCFYAPNNIISGGISGVSIMVNHFTSVPLGLVILLLNIPIFIFGFIKLGKSIGIATIYGTISLSLFADLFSVFGRFTDDLLLATVFGSLIDGIGFGLIFHVNATTGGVDIIANIIKKYYRHLRLGKIILFVDLIIIISAMIVYRNINIGLYSILSLWMTSHILDTVLEGFNFAKLLFVVSDYSDEISEKINTQLSRGATMLHGYGSYTKKHKNIIMCTIKPKEIPLLKDIIKSVDDSAFVLITDVKEVLGEGFLDY